MCRIRSHGPLCLTARQPPNQSTAANRWPRDAEGAVSASRRTGADRSSFVFFPGDRVFGMFCVPNLRGLCLGSVFTHSFFNKGISHSLVSLWHCASYGSRLNSVVVAPLAGTNICWYVTG